MSIGALYASESNRIELNGPIRSNGLKLKPHFAPSSGRVFFFFFISLQNARDRVEWSGQSLNSSRRNVFGARTARVNVDNKMNEFPYGPLHNRFFSPLYFNAIVSRWHDPRLIVSIFRCAFLSFRNRAHWIPFRLSIAILNAVSGRARQRHRCCRTTASLTIVDRWRAGKLFRLCFKSLAAWRKFAEHAQRSCRHTRSQERRERERKKAE